MDQQERISTIENTLCGLDEMSHERQKLTMEIMRTKEDLIKLVIEAKLTDCLTVDTRKLRQAFRRANR